MGIETEVKVPIEDTVEFVRSLHRLHTVSVSPRHFEDNHILDYSDSRIHSAQGLLRVRITSHAAYVTFKGPVRPGGSFKSREEVETKVENGGKILRIFQELGLRTWFRYQKYRQEYDVTSVHNPLLKVHVAVDETPIGKFVEFEGPEEGIREVADAMGFMESRFLRDSYYGLYCRHCDLHGVPVSHMVFAPEQDGSAIANRGEVQ